MLARGFSHGWNTGEWRMPTHIDTPLTAKPKALPSFVMASEDRKFLQHRGFDWTSIRRAWHRYQTEPGAKLRGGSTISQQVARNVFLWQGRSWLRKGLEAWYTFWLETFVPKERILEVYTNVAEQAPMTFGFEAGAQYWYHKPLAKLNRQQLASLVAMLPAPNTWTVRTPHVRERSGWIVDSPVAWRP
jgi:monofunctional biosynthetic peptidoglycan transglycosylase